MLSRALEYAEEKQIIRDSNAQLEDFMKGYIQAQLEQPEDWSPLSGYPFFDVEHNTFIRTSSLPYFCARREAILFIEHLLSGKKPVETIPAYINWAFVVGRAVHKALRQVIAPLLVGIWRCSKCGAVLYTDMDGNVVKVYERAPDREEAVTATTPLGKYPQSECPVCLCKEEDNFSYVEPYLVSEKLGLSGHCDGLLQLPMYNNLVLLEIKTMSQWRYKKFEDAPLPSEIIQIAGYALLCKEILKLDIRKGMLLRVAKDFDKKVKLTLSNISATVFDIPQEAGQMILAEVEQYKRFAHDLAGKNSEVVLPKRHCESPNDVQCPVKEICFQRESYRLDKKLLKYDRGERRWVYAWQSSQAKKKKGKEQAEEIDGGNS